MSTAFYQDDTHHHLLAHLEALYPQCDAVVLSDYRYGALTASLIEHLQALQHAHPKLVLLDAQEPARFREVPVTIVTAN